MNINEKHYDTLFEKRLRLIQTMKKREAEFQRLRAEFAKLHDHLQKMIRIQDRNRNTHQALNREISEWVRRHGALKYPGRRLNEVEEIVKARPGGWVYHQVLFKPGNVIQPGSNRSSKKPKTNFKPVGTIPTFEEFKRLRNLGQL
jgi:hypothetical protein